MARSSSKGRRVDSYYNNANRYRLPRPWSPNYTIFHRNTVPEGLKLYEDRRQWHPEGSARPAASFSQSRHRFTLVDRPPSHREIFARDRFAKIRSFPSQTRAILAFQSPSRVLICVRRKIRQEVLHALHKTGMSGQRRPRHNWSSEISCRS